MFSGCVCKRIPFGSIGHHKVMEMENMKGENVLFISAWTLCCSFYHDGHARALISGTSNRYSSPRRFFVSITLIWLFPC